MSGALRHRKIRSGARLWLCALALAATNPIAANAQDITSNLIGHWKLNETSGASITDSSGSGYTGTWADGSGNSVAEEAVNGINVSAINFDGTNDVITVGNVPAMVGIQRMTISAWLKRDAAGAHVHVSDDDGSGTGNTIGFWSDGQLYCMVSDGGYDTGSYTLNDTNWHHVAMVYDGTQTGNANRLRCYVDGAQVAMGFNGTIPATTYATPSLNFRIGQYRTTDYTNGSIDEVRVYDRALTAADVTTLYNYGRYAGPMACNASYAGVMIYNKDQSVMQYCNASDWIAMGRAAPSIPTDNLVGHWPLDETTGSSISDTTGNGHTGTWADGSGNSVAEETTSGMIRNAITFDGTNDTITATRTAAVDDLGSGSGLTVCTWIYPHTEPSGGYSIVGKMSGSPAYNGWNLYLITDGTGEIGFSSNYHRWKETGNLTPLLNGWHHVCATWNGGSAASDILLYLDGVDAGATGGTGGSGTWASDASYDIKIGNNNSSNEPFDGAIDDVRVYNTVLTPAQIQDIYEASGGAPGLACTSPAGAPGEVIYNTSARRMQYCNGAQWVSMGPEIAQSSSTPGSMVGYWTMNDTSGGFLNDSSSNALHAVWVDGVNDDVTEETIAGQVGTAVAFDNAQTIGWVPFSSALELTNSTGGTVSAWIRPNNSDIGQNGVWPVFCKQIHGNIFVGCAYTLELHQSGSGDPAYISSRFNGTNFQSTTTPVTGGQWWHVAMTWNSTTANLYLNGALEYTGAIPDTITYAEDAGAMIGSSIGYNGSGYVADGRIDDLRVFNRPLSATEIGQVYNNTFVDSLDLSSGLVGHWQMDETSGTAVADETTNNNDGTWAGSGAVDDVAGVQGGALSFDSTDNQITIPHHASQNVSTAYTVSGWVYINGHHHGNPIFSKNNVGSWGSRLSLFQTDGGGDVVDGRVRLGLCHDEDCIWTNWDFPYQQWFYLTVTWDGATARFYSMDKEVYSEALATAPTINTGDLEWGFANINWGWYWFDGRLDDMRLYNRALSAAEIDALVDENYTPVSSAPLVARYKLDESAGTTAADTTGINNAAFVGAPTWQPAGGQIAGAIEFNGAGQALNGGSDASLDNLYTTGMTVCAWIRPTGYDVSWPSVVSKATGNDADTGGWELFTESSGMFGFIKNHRSCTLSPSGLVQTNRWQHICATWDGGGTNQGVHLYYNSTPSNDNIWLCGGAEATPDDDSSAELRIGHAQTGTERYTGLIDDVRIYGGVLHDSEIRAIYMSRGCSDPDGVAGEMVYNATHSIMQYCDGGNWVGIGDTP